MKPPLVSIGFPVYNGAEFLARAVDSILNQDFNDFELIIADNASTDETELLCRAYAKNDSRIRYVRNSANIGVNPNHNLVFEMSRGRYFAWAAHDIEQLPGMLSRCVREMQNGPGAPVLVYPRCELAGDSGMPPGWEQPSIASSDPKPARRVNAVIRNIVFVTQHYGLFDAATLRKTRLNGSYPSSDYVLTAEVAMLGEIREIPEVLLRRTIQKDRGTAAVINDKRAWVAFSTHNARSRTILSVRERLTLEYFRAPWRLPLKFTEKWVCSFTAVTAHYRRELWEHSGTGGRRLVQLLGGLRRMLV
jgi:glycosyltransferase involved in cell wall biosynthesis